MSPVLTASIALCLAHTSARAEVDVEPGRLYEVSIDGVTVALAPDETRRVEVGEHAHDVKLVAQPFRRFDKFGVSFRFPTHFAYSFSEPNHLMRHWALAGNNLHVIVQRHQVDVDPVELLKVAVPVFRRTYRNPQITEEEIELVIGDRTFPGRMVRLEMGGNVVMQEIFAFKSGECVFALMLQDIRTGPDVEGEDFIYMKRLLRDSLEVKP